MLSAVVFSAIIFILLLPICARGQAGFPLWTNRYNGPGNGDDFVSSICVAPSGDVIVTGYARASNGFDEYTTIKYSSAGMPLWTNRYGGPVNGHDQALALAVDSNGHAYVTGSSIGIGTGKDFATIKYSSNGIPLWTNRYTSSGSSDEVARGVAVDDAGRVYVTGGSDYFSGMHGWVTIAYSSNGIPLWTNRFNAAMNGPDTARALVVANNHVYVTGDSISNGVSFDIVTIAYTNSGAGLWTNRFSSPGNFDDLTSAITVSRTNVYVAGLSVNEDFLTTDQVTLAYSSGGATLWTNRIRTGTSIHQIFRSPVCLATDGDGNVYHAGNSALGGGIDYATVAYSSSGLPLWTNSYHYSTDMALGVTTDKANNVFVVGRSGFDFAALAYSQEGASIWTNRCHGPGTGGDSGSGIVTDADGNVYVIGHSRGSTGNYDYAIIKYATLNPPPIPLEFQRTGTAMVLSWTNPAFLLQAAPVVSGAFTNIPSATSPYTNSMTDSQQFFRLKAN